MTWWMIGFASWMLLGTLAALAFGRFVRFIEAEPVNAFDLVMAKARSELAELVNRQLPTEVATPAPAQGEAPRQGRRAA